MTVLVTGGAGYIGSVVAQQLLAQSHTVVVIDNLQEGHIEAVLDEVVFFEGDYGDKTILKRIFKNYEINVVLHFGAETTIEFSMTKPGLYFGNNVVNGLVLLNSMLKYNCKSIIFSSTAATYGEPLEIPITENHPTNPVNAYGESKLIFEKILEWYHKAYGLKYITFRYFNAAGAMDSLGEDHRHESHLIPVVIQAVLGKRSHVDVYGSNYPTKDGTCIRDFIHVIDIAEAHILGLKKLDQFPNSIYNLGNGEGFSVVDVIQTVESVSGHKVPYRIIDKRPGDPANLVASSEKVQRELGWKPRFPDLKTIVESAWRWHFDHPSGYKD